MPFDPHHRQDDDMSGLGLPAGVFQPAHQAAPLGKFNYSSHATPFPTAARAQAPLPQGRRTNPIPIKPRPWLTVR